MEYTVFYTDRNGYRNMLAKSTLQAAEAFANEVYDMCYENVMVRDSNGQVVYKPALILVDELQENRQMSKNAAFVTAHIWIATSYILEDGFEQTMSIIFAVAFLAAYTVMLFTDYD